MRRKERNLKKRLLGLRKGRENGEGK